MKKIHFFCTRLRYFWTEIPLIALLVIAIYYNQFANSDPETGNVGIFKLYPLIIISAAAVVFVFLFLFRMVSLSYQEIHDVGIFSNKDSAAIEEGRFLLLTRKKRRRTQISLHCVDDDPALPWAKREAGEEPLIVRLFKGSLVGVKRPCRRVLKYYGVDAEDIAQILSEVGFERDYENVTVSTFNNDNGEFTVKILINVTI